MCFVWNVFLGFVFVWLSMGVILGFVCGLDGVVVGVDAAWWLVAFGGVWSGFVLWGVGCWWFGLVGYWVCGGLMLFSFDVGVFYLSGCFIWNLGL